MEIKISVQTVKESFGVTTFCTAFCGNIVG